MHAHARNNTGTDTEKQAQQQTTTDNNNSNWLRTFSSMVVCRIEVAVVDKLCASTVKGHRKLHALVRLHNNIKHTKHVHGVRPKREDVLTPPKLKW